jgi:hypothetical protein
MLLRHCVVAEAGCNWYLFDINIFPLSEKEKEKEAALRPTPLARWQVEKQAAASGRSDDCRLPCHGVQLEIADVKTARKLRTTIRLWRHDSMPVPHLY